MEKNIELLHGDCLEPMKDIDDKSIDMVICGLPYGVTQNKSDIRIPFDENYFEISKQRLTDRKL